MTPEDWQNEPAKQAELRRLLNEPILKSALATVRAKARPRTFNPTSAEAAGLKLYQMAGWLDALDQLEQLCETPEKERVPKDAVKIGDRYITPEQFAHMTPEELASLHAEHFNPNQT